MTDAEREKARQVRVDADKEDEEQQLEKDQSKIISKNARIYNTNFSCR